MTKFLINIVLGILSVSNLCAQIDFDKMEIYFSKDGDYIFFNSSPPTQSSYCLESFENDEFRKRYLKRDNVFCREEYKNQKMRYFDTIDYTVFLDQYNLISEYDRIDSSQFEIIVTNLNQTKDYVSYSNDTFKVPIFEIKVVYNGDTIIESKGEATTFDVDNIESQLKNSILVRNKNKSRYFFYGGYETEIENPRTKEILGYMTILSTKWKE